MGEEYEVDTLIIHRHTGGLENAGDETPPASPIHRHTGGLEIIIFFSISIILIHRHTGGLEKTLLLIL